MEFIPINLIIFKAPPFQIWSSYCTGLTYFPPPSHCGSLFGRQLKRENLKPNNFISHQFTKWLVFCSNKEHHTDQNWKLQGHYHWNPLLLLRYCKFVVVLNGMFLLFWPHVFMSILKTQLQILTRKQDQLFMGLEFTVNKVIITILRDSNYMGQIPTTQLTTRFCSLQVVFIL